MGKFNSFNRTVCRLLRVKSSKFQTFYLRRELPTQANNAASKAVPHLSNVDNSDLEPSRWGCIKENNVCLFHKPTKNVFLIPIEHLSKDLTPLKCSPSVDIQIKDVQNRAPVQNSELEQHVNEEILDLKNPANLTWREIRPNFNFRPYLSLAKIRLTSFVVMTSMAGYVLAPGAFDLSAFLSCSAGVLFTSSAANAVNQFFEVPFDSQMARTMNRPIVRGLVTPQQAVAFAAASGSLGVLVMCCGTNLLTASLGLANMAFYTLLYTPMKRTNISNTWVGSVVGAIPPMMGWAAATGRLDAGAWLLGGVLFAWQFPHFCALSWNLQSDYSKAGYRMMSVVDPLLCKRVALKYSLVLVGLSFAFPVCGVTTWTFAVDSLPPNCYLSYLAWNFYNAGDSASSRKLFKFSLVYLPVLLSLIIISKKFPPAKDEVLAEEILPDRCVSTNF